MAFEDWFIARARVASKPHKKITLDDKITFFQQLATLVSSGTPLLQIPRRCSVRLSTHNPYYRRSSFQTQRPAPWIH